MVELTSFYENCIKIGLESEKLCKKGQTKIPQYRKRFSVFNVQKELKSSHKVNYPNR